MTTAVITQTFIPGPRLIDGSDLNNLVTQANAGFTGVYSTLQVGTLSVTGLASLSTAQIGTLSATRLVALNTSQISAISTTQIGTLSAGSILGATTYTANGATGVSVTIGGLTTSCVLQFGLKTVGGTVGAVPRAIFPPNPTTGVVVIAGTAADTSVYNVAAIG